MSNHTISTTFLASTLALALVGCGGGGGGGDEGELGVSIDPGQQIFASVRVNDTLPTITIYGSFTGDLDELRDNNFWFWIDDLDDLVEDIDSMIVGTVWGVTLKFYEAQVVGRYSGVMTLSICRDEACAEPLVGSPFRIPYDVAVLPPLDAFSNP